MLGRKLSRISERVPSWESQSLGCAATSESILHTWWGATREVIKACCNCVNQINLFIFWLENLDKRTCWEADERGDQGMFTLNKCTALKGILILHLDFWLKCLGEKKFKFSNSRIWARSSGQVNSSGTLGGGRRRWSGNKHRCAFDQFPVEWSSIDWRLWWFWWFMIDDWRWWWWWERLMKDCDQSLTEEEEVAIYENEEERFWAPD